MMTYDQLLTRVIDDGIAEVREAYADPKDHHKRDGAIEGFEACRGKTPDELVELWRRAEDETRQMYADRESDVTLYWRRRYKTLQVEWCLNVISVGLVHDGQPPLLAHLPTARAALKYTNVVGDLGVL